MGSSKYETDLEWFGCAADCGIEASALIIYIFEWLHRMEKDFITNPSSGVRLHMLAMLAKLQRRSLAQHLRVSIQSTFLQRDRILPFCGIPEVALQRCQTLQAARWSGLFAGAFQSTFTNEASRRDTLLKTTFSAARSTRKRRRYQATPLTERCWKKRCKTFFSNKRSFGTGRGFRPRFSATFFMAPKKGGN